MTILLACLALALSLAACKKDEPPPAESPESVGTMSAHWKFAELAIDEVRIESAIAYVEPNEITIELAGPGIAGIDCGHAWSDKKLERGQLGIVLRSKGLKYSVPFNRKAGKLAGVGYTMFYRAKDAAHGTNSGSSARRDLPTELTISQLDDKVVQGSFSLTFSETEKASGRFSAKICRP